LVVLWCCQSGEAFFRKQEDRTQETGRQDSGNRRIGYRRTGKQDCNADIPVGTFVLKMVDRNQYA